MNAQREYFRPHQRLRMRKSYTIALVTLLAVLTLTVAVVGVERIANKFVLYVRVARLYTQDPPRKIVDASSSLEESDSKHLARASRRESPA